MEGAWRAVQLLGLVTALGAPRAARGDPVSVQAHDVVLDARRQSLVLSGDVRISAPPFFLTSEHLALRRSPLGVSLDGEGRVGFCPCLGTPLAVRFTSALVAPPSDVLVRGAWLEVAGVPVLYAPRFWLRSPERAGLLPPIVAYRGGDGLLLGGGVHIPWQPDDAAHGLDMTGAGYVAGGGRAEARLTTERSTTRIVWDYLGSSSLAADARGATDPAFQRAAVSASWDVDVVRGARGVAATTELAPAAQPFDRASAEVSWRAYRLTVASAIRSVSTRGGEPFGTEAIGPVAMVHRGGGVAENVLYEATFDGGAVRGADPGTVSFARGEGELRAVGHVGPLGALLSGRALGLVVSDGTAQGATLRADTRAALALPVARSFVASGGRDPWIHRIEPRISAGAVAETGQGITPAFLQGRGVQSGGGYWIAGGDVVTALGRYGARAAGELTAAVGLVGRSADVTPVGRVLAAAGAEWIGAGLEGAWVMPGGATPSGTVLSGRLRIGRLDRLHAGAMAAGRWGENPVRARALLDASLEPPGGWLATEGVSAAGLVALPWAAWLVTRARLDADVTARTLLAARTELEFRDRCRCFAARFYGAHRLGRAGVDIGLAIDLTPAY